MNPLLDILIDPSSAAPRLMMHRDAQGCTHPRCTHSAGSMQIQAPALKVHAIQPYAKALEIDAFVFYQSTVGARKLVQSLWSLNS